MNVEAKRSGHSLLERRPTPDVRNPTPFDTPERFWRAMAQAATMLMAVLLFGICLYFARALLLPILCAVVVGMTLGPILGYASRHRIPAWLVASATVLLLIGILNLAIVTLAQPVADQVARLPEVGAAIKDKLHIIDRPIVALRELQSALGLETSSSTLSGAPGRLIEGVVTVVTPAAVQFLIQVVLFFGTLFFFIAGRTGFRRYVVTWFTSRDARLRTLKILNDIEENLSGYLIVVTAINLALGIVTAIAAYFLGLPAPLLWGALAFGLNYIPYVGPAIMYILLFVIGLLTYPTLLGALLPPAIFMVATLIEGQFITPAIVGRRVLNLNPLAIFLSIAFWAWLWGPIGAFLATPILIVARVALDHLYPRRTAELPE